MALTTRSSWLRCLASVVVLTIGCLASDISAQTATPQRPRQTKPQPSRPAPKPAPPSAKPDTKPPEPVKPPAPAPEDVRFKSVYTTGDQRTETVTFIKGLRERYEFQDMVLLKQHDQKRTVQISRAANTYLVAPEGMPVTASPAPAAPPRPPGVIVVATTIVDTGERKAAFGQQARRVKTIIDKQPMPGACDASKQRVETDGWYIDAPVAVANRPAAPEQPAVPGDCADQTQATINGDPKALGFPIAYKTSITGDDGKAVVATMEVTEFEATTLDAALFEIPPGLNAALNLRDLSKALSDAHEAKLAAADAAPAAAPPAKAPGVIRIGVPELTNKTAQTVDTRALRQRLIGDLAQAKFDAVPMAAASPAELQQRAGESGYDYILLAEVTELKASKPGKLGGLMGAAAGVASGTGPANTPKETTESAIAVKLLQPDGKSRLSTTAKGKDGSGFSLKTGLGVAKFAGGMYLTMMAGPMMMSRLNSMGAANMGGMGMLGNPMLYRMQGAGLGGLGKGIGMDATAGAASVVMGTAMQMNDLGGYVGVPGQGPSYDESLGEAVQNAAKAVQKALEKK